MMLALNQTMQEISYYTLLKNPVRLKNLILIPDLFSSWAAVPTVSLKKKPCLNGSFIYSSYPPSFSSVLSRIFPAASAIYHSFFSIGRGGDVISNLWGGENLFITASLPTGPFGIPFLTVFHPDRRQFFQDDSVHRHRGGDPSLERTTKWQYFYRIHPRRPAHDRPRLGHSLHLEVFLRSQSGCP